MLLVASENLTEIATANATQNTILRNWFLKPDLFGKLALGIRPPRIL